MSRFGFRDALIRLLGGEPHREDENEPIGVRMFVVGPNGPIPVSPGETAPPNMPSHIAQILGLNPNQEHTPPSVVRVSTLRRGPATKDFSLRVIDCVSQMDPASDPEVQMLLSAGWEPFGVHKFSSFTGAEGVRIYFKRANRVSDEV